MNKVGETAAKEYQIEQALAKMKADWALVDFEAIPYKKTGTSCRGFNDCDGIRLLFCGLPLFFFIQALLS